MKRERRLLPLFAALGLLFGQASFAAGGDVLAVVNGKKITQGDYDRYAKSVDDGHGHGANSSEALQELINIELISADGAAKKYDKDAEFVAAMGDIKRSQLAAFTARKAVAAAPLSEDEIKAEYTRLIGELPKHEYRARHIMAGSEEEAKVIAAELAKGGDFETLARQKSIDGYAEQGGDLGWFTLDQMEEPFANALKGLKAGESTPAPVQTSYGWHLIRLEEVRDMQPPLEQVEGQIRGALLNKRFQGYIESLRAKAKIDIK